MMDAMLLEGVSVGGVSDEALAGAKRAERTGEERFRAVRVTPAELSEAAEEGAQGELREVRLDGRGYRVTPRFLKGLAQRMGVPASVFSLFPPGAVLRRGAEVHPDLPLRVTADESEGLLLGLVEDKGAPVPVGAIERSMREDRRLAKFGYADGVMKGTFDLSETWSIAGDSDYRVQVRVSVPVDGMGAPEATLGLMRLICSNGAVAEASAFRTKLEARDGDGGHFRRLLESFSNPRGVEALRGRLLAAAGTKASVGEVYKVEEFLRRQVERSEVSMRLRERLQEVAGNPCVRYGVTDIGAIGARRRALLPADCPVADLLNFVTELATHHGRFLKDPGAADALLGAFFTSDFDLEEMYPTSRGARERLLEGVAFPARSGA